MRATPNLDLKRFVPILFSQTLEYWVENRRCMHPAIRSLTEADDGQLFVVRIASTGEERIARYHHRKMAGQDLRFPRFTDPNHPDDYRLWVHDGWGGYAVRRV